MSGLSPRMRGNPHFGVWAYSLSRSIPAYAGEPIPIATSAGMRQVYPRVCGGTPARRPRRVAAPGLSPRMRGNPYPRPARRANARSIPAYAGEPRARRQTARRPPVYPRVCGGTDYWRIARRRRQGLSPRMRGNREKLGNVNDYEGSIPAYAGEPYRWHSCQCGIWVYPRVCGGTTHAPRTADRDGGLSPRMRGNLFRRSRLRPCWRSIPAYAGEPGRSRCKGRRSRVYPRVCGGTIDGWALAAVAHGLSPRMRGNPRPGVARRRSPGSIPAYAGEPEPRGPLVWGVDGLSPRMRGNLPD